MSDESTTMISEGGDDRQKKTHELLWSQFRTGLKLLGLAIACLALLSPGGPIRRSGAVDYCWIEVEPSRHPAYILRGHRPWNPDPLMGVFDTFELAQEAAESVEGCHREKKTTP